MRKQFEIFFSSYARSMEEAYEGYIEVNTCDLTKAFDTEDSKLDELIEKHYQKWLSEPIESLDGKTPAEFMDTVCKLDELKEMFICGAIICDDELPGIFIRRLKSFGEDAEKLLAEIAGGISEEGEESLLAPVMAVKVLGNWKSVGSIGLLLDILYSQAELYELMCETVKDALINIGAPSMDMIIGRLNREHSSSAADDYLLMALSAIGRNYRSDKVYNCLKKAFMEMPQKTVPADCLAQYGDGRAVPAIRGYLKKNSGQLDRDTFYDLVSAIKHLGGNTGDLKFEEGI